MGQPACNRDAIWELACRSDDVTKKEEASKKKHVRRWAEEKGHMEKEQKGQGQPEDAQREQANMMRRATRGGDMYASQIPMDTVAPTSCKISMQDVVAGCNRMQVTPQTGS